MKKILFTLLFAFPLLVNAQTLLGPAGKLFSISNGATSTYVGTIDLGTLNADSISFQVVSEDSLAYELVLKPAHEVTAAERLSDSSSIPPIGQDVKGPVRLVGAQDTLHGWHKATHNLPVVKWQRKFKVYVNGVATGSSLTSKSKQARILMRVHK